MALPANSPVTCPNCGAYFPAAVSALAMLGQCPACARPTKVILFPAFDRPAAAGAKAEKVVMDDEAACFFHPGNRAHVPCDNCGRFLCALCDLDLNGRHFCSPCLEKATSKNSLEAIERNRTRWDQIIAALVILPVVLCYFMVPVTSLAALVLIGWKWKAPPSRVSNPRPRLIIYAILAVIELVTGSILWDMFFNGK